MIHRYLTIFCQSCGHQFVVAERCGNRFCEVCGHHRRNRMVRHITAMLKNVVTTRNLRLRFITFTLPSQSDPRSQYKSLVKSFRKLRQRKWWKSNVEGGLSFFEVTFNETKGWHVHLHIIALSKYLPQKKLSRQFEACGGGPICDIRLISSKSVVGYVTKYTLKTAMPEDLQLTASKALAGSRLYQPFGDFHGLALVTKPAPPICSHCGGFNFAIQFDSEMLSHAVDRISVDMPEVLTNESPPRHYVDNQTVLDIGSREYQRF
jgi:hypothetical protein